MADDEEHAAHRSGEVAFIETVPESEASGKLGELYQKLTDPSSGQVDHVLKVHSLRPAGLGHHYDYYRSLMTGSRGFPKADREMIATVVSRINDCYY